MNLKNFEGFRSSLELLPVFESIHQKDRHRFLVDAYKLARQKYRYQRWMEGTREAAKSIRASTKGRFIRVAKHIHNALWEIEEAKKATPTGWSTVMRHLQILEAAHLLRASYDDLGFLIAMDIAAIPPRHRNKNEKDHRAIYPHGLLRKFEEKFAEMPTGQAHARLNYLLSAALSSRLDRCRTSTGKPLRPIQRQRIISGVFGSALEQRYPKATVKTALRRTS